MSAPLLNEMKRELAIKSFGTIEPDQRLKLVLRALAALKGEGHHFSYTLVGGSDDWPGVRELVQEFGLAECVTIDEGAAPDEVREQMVGTDIALCLHDCSLNGGLLGALMERGVAAVIFDSGRAEGLPSEAVVKVDADRHAEKLLKAFLERLMTDDALRERIGANARLYAEERRAAQRASAANNGPVNGLDQFAHGRFQKLEGLDYKRGARLYPDRLDASNRHHLLTKPFYNLAHKIERWKGEGMDEDTRRQFCDFANMAVTLALPTTARLLDVGCGSGWLSEYFARLGYDVTGIDISPGLVEMARERLSRVPFGVDAETPLRCRFLAHDVESGPLAETFDAVICYDALHHFEDERAVLQNLSRMLAEGGWLFVLEGERPPEGSATEEELRGVMLEYETLESPFSREYLRALLVQHGFAVVGDYASVNGLFEREMMSTDGKLLVQPEPVNYLLCKKVGAGAGGRAILDSREPGLLRARWTVQAGPQPQCVAPSSPLEFSVEVLNDGDTLWLVSREPLRGRVRVASRLLDVTGAIMEEVHGVPPLPRSLAPGERVSLKVRQQAPARPGAYTLRLDLVDQDVCWFEERGSLPLSLPFRVE